MAENERKYAYRVEIDTMEDAKQLVAISTKLKGKIILQSGNKFAVNAKSLLGVILAKKLNWDDLRLVMDNDYYFEYQRFIKS
ncbi:MAG: HPr family phosphocarrier protein [Clostridia bacterium]|nr:HPr family phosphocarrier protein [Clostridia bacterium]